MKRSGDAARAVAQLGAYAPRGRGPCDARAARAHSVRDVMPTQRARHSLRAPAPPHRPLLYLPLLLLRLFIYGQKLNKSVSAGSE